MDAARIILRELDQIRKQTLQKLAGLVQEQLDWQPPGWTVSTIDETDWSLGEIIMHLTIDEHYLREQIALPVLEGIKPLEDILSLPPPPPYGKSKEAIQYWFTHARRATRAMVETLPENVNLELKHIGGLEAMNGLEWLLGYGGHESFHHTQIHETIRLYDQREAPMIYIATNSGMVTADLQDDWRVLGLSLVGKQVTSVIAREGVVLAGTTDGIYRSDDGGRSWRETSAGLNARHIRWLAYHPGISDFEIAGTEPAGIYISQDGANSWHEAAEVSQLRDRYHWFLPYSPEAGCVRGFAFHGPRIYAAVEVGGVLRSDDNGATWQLAEGSDGNPDLNGPPEPFIYPDLHSIYVHPSSPDLVFAATGGDFYRSLDGGKTWKSLYNCYCRAAWVDACDASHLVLGPADGVESNGRIEESLDGGATWRPITAGLDLPWPGHMVERFIQVGAELFAVLSNGQLIAAPLKNFEWQTVLPEVKAVNALTSDGFGS